MKFTPLCLLLLFFIMFNDAESANTLYGYSGNILTPSAIAPRDGTLTLGISRIPKLYDDSLRPFSRRVFSSSLVLMPRFEVMLSITRPDEYAGGIGDRSGAFRLFLCDEKKYFPALAVGAQDFFGASQIHLEPVSAQHFSAAYIVATKNLYHNQLQATAGYGQDVFTANSHHLVGAFAAMQYHPQQWMALILEYDSVNWNAGANFTVFNNTIFQLSWWKFRHLMGSITFRIQLLD